MGKVLHASYSGYFPRCIETGDDGQIEGNLVQLMALYWRVKRWSVNITGSLFTDIFPPSSLTVIDGQFDLQDTATPLVTKEEDLVCPTYSSYINRGSIPSREFSSTGGSILDSNSQEPTQIFFIFNFLSAPKSGATLNLTTAIQAQWFASNEGTFLPFANIDSDPINGVIYPNSTYSINFAGANLSGSLFNILDQGSINIDINAEEYWSYDGTWNTADGAPL